LFSSFGVAPEKAAVIVVKSSQHFHAAFAPIAREVLYVAAPGVVTSDFATLPYRKAPPIWPLTGRS